MNKRFTTLLVVTFLLTLLPACAQGAPSQVDVSNQCQQENRQPGQTVGFAGSEYPCPSPTSTPTPLVNVTNMLIQTLASVCKENGETWQSGSNADWLARNVVAPASSWQYQSQHWVYTYVPEFVTLTFGGYTQEYEQSFSYPGFGTFYVTLYEGGSTTVNSNSQSTWLKFTKLELSCP